MDADLARALVALPGWRWVPGMLAVYPGREHYGEARLSWTVTENDERAEYMGHDYAGSFPTWGWPSPGSGWLPDLDDPATAGCLLAMVLALDPSASIESLGREPVLYVDVGDDTDTPCSGPTLGEACARALVALGRCA